MREVNYIMWRKEKRQRDEGETDRWRKLKPWETGITLLGYTECICFERTPRDRAHTTWWLREQMNSTPSPPSRLTKRLSPCCVCPSVCLKHCLSLFVGLCTVCTPVYLSFCPPVLFWQSVCLWAFICRSASLSLCLPAHLSRCPSNHQPIQLFARMPIPLPPHCLSLLLIIREWVVSWWTIHGHFKHSHDRGQRLWLQVWRQLFFFYQGWLAEDVRA